MSARPSLALFPRVPAAYRQPWFGGWDARFLNCLLGASALGLALLLYIHTQPYRAEEIVHIEDLPPRFARLVREVEQPPAPRGAAEAPRGPSTKPGRGTGALPWPNGKPDAVPGPPGPLSARPGARGPGHGPGSGGGSAGGNGGGAAGRNLTAALAGAQQSMGTLLDGLSPALASSGASRGAAGNATGVGSGATASGGVSARRSPRGGRSAAELALAGGSGVGGAVGPGSGSGGGSGSGSESSLAGALVSVESVLPLGGAGGGGGGGGGASDGSGGGGRRRSAGDAAKPSAYRTNASLLAVVRRNAAGIQFCYDNELKHAPDLRGKLTIAMTVAPSGEITEVTAVANSVGSADLLACVLSQIREWRFAEIPEGTTRFQVPFVFTPPK